MLLLIQSILSWVILILLIVESTKIKKINIKAKINALIAIMELIRIVILVQDKTNNTSYRGLTLITAILIFVFSITSTIILETIYRKMKSES